MLDWKDPELSLGQGAGSRPLGIPGAHLPRSLTPQAVARQLPDWVPDLQGAGTRSIFSPAPWGPGR